ncbi:MAG TPA: M50 family metallopeptidase, partial [Thermoleophilia bacterium]|nr:M50 family metallopeptidase [Thermoleophilia bacterium]
LGGAILITLLLGQWVWLIAILGLALLITVHEFGHFIAAKSFGMRVEKFYVGFPPAALRRTWGETEYGIGIIPLGGFCKISGMTPEEEVPEGTGERVYHQKAVWKRNVTIAAGPFMNFLAAAVIIVLFVGIAGIPKASLKLAEVVPGSPAAKAGLTAGATLVGADGHRWTTWDQASAYFRARPHETIELTYLPAGVKGGASGSGGANGSGSANGSGGANGAAAERTVAVTLAENPQAKGSGYLGVAAGVVRDHPGPVRALGLGLLSFRDIVVGTFTGFWWLASGKISATGPDGAAGPVGIIKVSQQAVKQDWYPVLLAFLSFNLGLINLLPILPFDGGHIALNLLEKVRGRRLSAVVFERMLAFGTVLLVLLFIFLTFNDVKKLFGG